MKAFPCPSLGQLPRLEFAAISRSSLIAEKEAFKEMLYFIYAGSLSPRFGDPSTDSREHVALLALADKFEVPSFMSAVIDCLSKLERSASRTVSDSVALVCALSGVFERRPKARRLADEARAHVVQGFRDVSATWASPEFLSLELGAVEILMQAEELEAESEEEIFERLLGWVRERYSGMEERKAVMTRLLPSVRFHCMRGEFLEKLLTYAELGSTEAAQMIERAFRFIAYSDDKKQEMIEVPGQRKGVQDVHLEINGVFSLTDTDELSGSVEWLGAAWYLQVEVSKNGEDQRHDVTLSLMCEEVIKHPSSTDSWSMDVEFSFYVKTWPNRYWKLLHKDRQKFTFTYDVHEVPNALSILYDETKKPTSTLTGGTGAITVKVVARRLSKACDPKV